MSKPLFKPGDRVVCSNPPLSWELLMGAEGVVFRSDPWDGTHLIHVHWNSHKDDDYDPGSDQRWYTGGWEEKYFDLLPTSPFDQSVRDYIKSELASR